MEHVTSRNHSIPVVGGPGGRSLRWSLRSGVCALLLSALPACTLAAATSGPEDAPGEAMAADTWCDCDGLPTTPCSRPACDEHGTCYLDHTADGEPADEQPHGDCLTAVCVGLEVVQVYEPHDRPTLPDGCLTSVCTPAGPVWTERDGCLP